MKLSLGDRILAGIYVLLTLALGIAAGLRTIGADLVGDLLRSLTSLTEYWYLIFYGLLVIILLLGIYMLCLVFKRRPKGSAFVTVDSGENGKVIVAMSALEQMVRQAASNAQGISDMKIGVRGDDESISVAVELTVLGGVHLPTVTMGLQREIRRYVELNSGVAVRDVTVTVGAVITPEEAAQAASGKKRARKTNLQPPVVYQPEPVVKEPAAPIAVEEPAIPAAKEETEAPAAAEETVSPVGHGLDELIEAVLQGEADEFTADEEPDAYASSEDFVRTEEDGEAEILTEEDVLADDLYTADDQPADNA